MGLKADAFLGRRTELMNCGMHAATALISRFRQESSEREREAVAEAEKEKELCHLMDTRNGFCSMPNAKMTLPHIWSKSKWFDGKMIENGKVVRSANSMNSE